MAGSTTNLGLIKPLGSEKIRIAQINQNSDTLDAAIGAVGSTSLQAQVSAVEDGLAIVANGDSHVAITAGQFVYVRNNTHNLAEGLYVASANVSANASITSSNMTADASGGLNALNNKIDTVTQAGALPNNANANSYTEPATYYLYQSFTYSNLPIGYGMFRITRPYSGATFVMQEVYSANGAYYRTGSGGSWDDWRPLALNPTYSAITLNNGITGNVTLMRMGKLRMLTGYVNPNTSGANVALATLDVGDRPPVLIRGSFSGFGVTTTGEFNIYTNGVFEMAVKETPTNTVKFNITYGVS